MGCTVHPQGMYHEAARSFSHVLQQRPTDTAAARGLQEASKGVALMDMHDGELDQIIGIGSPGVALARKLNMPGIDLLRNSPTAQAAQQPLSSAAAAIVAARAHPPSAAARVPMEKETLHGGSTRAPDWPSQHPSPTACSTSGSPVLNLEAEPQPKWYLPPADDDRGHDRGQAKHREKTAATTTPIKQPAPTPAPTSSSSVFFVNPATAAAASAQHSTGGGASHRPATPPPEPSLVEQRDQEGAVVTSPTQMQSPPTVHQQRLLPTPTPQVSQPLGSSTVESSDDSGLRAWLDRRGLGTYTEVLLSEGFTETGDLEAMPSTCSALPCSSCAYE